MRLNWTKQALINLGQMIDYLETQDAPAAAKTIVTRIQRSVSFLRNNPELGREGRVQGTREMVVPRTPYIVAYRLTKEEIQILRVLHAARKWPDRM